jgi:homoserine kinase
MTFVPDAVTVEVPATSANLGPGFDCLGLALGLHDTLIATVADGLVVEIEGEGADDLPRDESHLVLRAMVAAFDLLGARPPGVRVQCTNRIPQSRGLGSSSAAIVGGIALARALAVDGEDRLPLEQALRLANQLEGHPDNVAPALLGGFVVSGQDDTDVWADRAPIDPRIGVVALVPPHGVRTEVARGLLPDSVPHRDAAANAGRAALLVAALGHAPERLLRATEDFLHQSYREPAMPATLALVRRLRAAGVPAVVSGAGPTVLAFVAATGARTTVGSLPPAADVAPHVPEGWRVLTLSIAGHGCRRV